MGMKLIKRTIRGALPLRARRTSDNKALTLLVLDKSFVQALHTSSPGGKHRQGVIWGPVQWFCECGTLYEILLRYLTQHIIDEYLSVFKYFI
jgi:hypothetical protein